MTEAMARRRDTVIGVLIVSLLLAALVLGASLGLVVRLIRGSH